MRDKRNALYGIAVISGLTDVDAITLSTAKLFNDGRVVASTAWRVILIATMSNLVFKAGAVAVLGSRRLLLWVAMLFGIALVCGGALLFLGEGINATVDTWLSPIIERLSRYLLPRGKLETRSNFPKQDLHAEYSKRGTGAMLPCRLRCCSGFALCSFAATAAARGGWRSRRRRRPGGFPHPTSSRRR